MADSEPVRPIACRLDALTPEERDRRVALARTIRGAVVETRETDEGYVLELSDDRDVCDRIVELIRLERRCCPFLALELAFPPGETRPRLVVGGTPDVKTFLTETGVLGCAPW